ncbi:MAG: nuclear transport factor 2 family protein [Gemmatimonadota bacterium]
MHPNAALIEKFYAAFARRDGRMMAGCYAPNASFSDPAFGELHGPRIGMMWRMLCERGTDLRVSASDILADDQTGVAHWEAHYTFSATGRAVHNVVNASFAFAEGRIVAHLDSFDFYRWARQALGIKGVLLGWAPPVQRSIREQATRALDGYSEKHVSGSTQQI